MTSAAKLSELAALLPVVLADLDLMADHLERYHRLSSDIALYRGVVSALAEQRDLAVVAMHSTSSYAKIAEMTGVSRARVQQLVKRGTA